jgi:hypothetical protein
MSIVVKLNELGNLNDWELFYKFALEFFAQRISNLNVKSLRAEKFDCLYGRVNFSWNAHKSIKCTRLVDPPENPQIH